MTDISIDWLAENFGDKPITVFEIGCAAMQDSIDFKRVIPQGTFYAFECCRDWMDINQNLSVDHGIHYFHWAMSDMDGYTLFYPAVKLDGQPWSNSGSVCRPMDEPRADTAFEWGEPYKVKTVRLDTFCDRFNVTPDFIHIDAQGAEHMVLGNMGRHKPKAIWAEICDFDSVYETGVTHRDFTELLQGLGYSLWAQKGPDELYVLDGYTVTEMP